MNRTAKIIAFAGGGAAVVAAAVLAVRRVRQSKAGAASAAAASDPERFDRFAQFILSWEGGFVNDPDDPGGATNKGITLATWQRRGYDKNGDGGITAADLRLITDDDAKNILRQYYWDKWQADQINDTSTAYLLVDWLWGSGTYGITIPQRLLGVAADGIVGPKTLAALNAKEPRNFFNALKARREQHFRNIAANNPSQQKFLAGWLRRLGGINYGSLTCNGGRTFTF